VQAGVMSPKTVATAIKVFVGILVVSAVGALGYYLYDTYYLHPPLTAVDKSVQEVQADLKRDPRSVNAHIRLGELFVKQNKLQDARQEFQKALTFGKNHPRAMLDLGLVEEQLGNTSAAEKVYLQMERNLSKTQFAQINTYLGDAFVRLGLIYVGRKQYVKGLDYYGKALTINPSDADILVLTANANYERGEYDKARVGYEQALRFVPDFGEAHLGLGKVLEKQGKKDEALAQYKLALRYNPELTEASAGLKRLEGK